LPEDLDQHCIQSVQNQTVPVDKILVFTRRYQGGTLAARVSRALNDGLKEANVKLEDYDYFMRLDGHTVLPKNFVEYALEKNCDLFGESVHAALVKTSAFMKLMNGRFHPECDEVYLTHKFAILGTACSSYGSLEIKHPFNEAKHSSIDHRSTGELLYKSGYEPIHLFFILRKFSKIHLLWFQGYLIALIERKTKFDFAKKLWNFQVHRLLRMKK
jgi:hypothetical protein